MGIGLFVLCGSRQLFQQLLLVARQETACSAAHSICPSKYSRRRSRHIFGIVTAPSRKFRIPALAASTK